MKVKEAFDQKVNSLHKKILKAIYAYDGGSITLLEMNDMLKTHTQEHMEDMFDWAFEIGLNTEVSNEEDGTVLDEMDLDEMERGDDR